MHPRNSSAIIRKLRACSKDHAKTNPTLHLILHGSSQLTPSPLAVLVINRKFSKTSWTAERSAGAELRDAIAGKDAAHCGVRTSDSSAFCELDVEYGTAEVSMLSLSLRNQDQSGNWMRLTGLNCVLLAWECIYFR